MVTIKFHWQRALLAFVACRSWWVVGLSVWTCIVRDGTLYIPSVCTTLIGSVGRPG